MRKENETTPEDGIDITDIASGEVDDADLNPELGEDPETDPNEEPEADSETEADPEAAPDVSRETPSGSLTDLSDEDLQAELNRRNPPPDPGLHPDTDVDTELEVRATQRTYLVRGILDDLAREESELPDSYRQQFEADLLMGPIVDGKRKPLSVGELDAIRKSGSLVTQAAGIVRRLQKAGKLQVKSNAPPEKKPNNGATPKPPVVKLSKDGDRLASAIARQIGISADDLLGRKN